jgi:DNA-binding transcriptional MocR family regulator
MLAKVALHGQGQSSENGSMASSMGARSLAAMLGGASRRPAGLADGLRALVVDGRLAARTRVPSERALAAELRVSRGSVSRAYDRLREEGYLASRRGAGSWLTLPGGAGSGPLPPPPGALDVGRVLDLTVAALPAPMPLLAEAADRAAQALRRHVHSHGYSPSGLPELREAVAARFTARGLPTAVDDVMITSGAQHALHLVLSLLTGPGDRVLVDAPAYPRTLSAIRTARARGVAVPLTAAGWDVEAWTAALAAASPRVALTAPDFHNPTGLTMSAPARAALGAACGSTGTVLVADETYSEMRLDGAPVPAPLAGHAASATVITIGTMSKVAWAGLRVGWLRAAPTLIAELAARRADIDMASPVLDQLLGVELLQRWDEVLASRRTLVRARRDALLQALADHAPNWRVRRPAGGLSAWVRLPAPTATRLAALAASDGVQVTPGPSFSVDGTFEQHVRLPFTLAPEDLEDAVARLAAIAARAGADGPTRSLGPLPAA